MKDNSAGCSLLAARCIARGFHRRQRAQAQDYPTRPITAIIPFAGGSASDVVSRILFDRMSKSMGQPIVVENRPGAGGNTGTADAAKAAPDGYTMLGSGSGPVAANVTLYKHLDYDPVKGFRNDLAVRGLHDRRRGEHQAAGQQPARPDRLRQSPSRANSITDRSASAVRSISPASISASSPAPSSRTSPTRISANTCRI